MNLKVKMTFRYWTNYYILGTGGYWRYYFTSFRMSNYATEGHHDWDGVSEDTKGSITLREGDQLIALI